MSGHSVNVKTGNGSLPLGVLFVAVGASSYGMLSTFVKLAYKQGFSTAEVIVAQFAWGILLLTLINQFVKHAAKPTRKDIVKLMLAGMPLGLTSIFYYSSVRYINASVAVVLLMQSVWIGVVVEAIQTKRMPGLSKIAGVILVLFGTLLATNAFGATHGSLDFRGVFFGVLSALSFSWTLFSTSSVGSHLSPGKRSQFMVCGGGVMVLIFALLTQIIPYSLNLEWVSHEMVNSKPFNFNIFLSYGFLVALFGTIIPPLMLNRGFPIVGVGLGSIVASMELPCAVTIAFMLLDEKVSVVQWTGVVTILSAIVLLNYKMIFSDANRAEKVVSST